MNRLFDPKDTENAQQRKYGLVVGYVQSGKTAHFTGFLAKAADAGFGLIVVLSGVYNDLRVNQGLSLQGAHRSPWTRRALPRPRDVTF